MMVLNDGEMMAGSKEGLLLLDHVAVHEVRKRMTVSQFS